MLKGYLGLFLTLSFGVFLFVLFFQPFPLDWFDYNNRLIFIAGMGVIVFLCMVLIRLFSSLWFQYEEQVNAMHEFHPLVRILGLLALSSVAFAFYLRYVGHVKISFHVMLKVLLICLAAPVVLRIFEIIHALRLQNESLLLEKRTLQKQLEKYEEDYLNKSIEFVSENNTELLKLQVSEVAFIRSADNYVEIVYREAGEFKKKLIRNTLKAMEQQIKMYSNFLRCHRICIVNTHFIEKLNASYDNHWISIKGSGEKIPVSRPYLLKIREIL